jgi:hypothetical protein
VPGRIFLPDSFASRKRANSSASAASRRSFRSDRDESWGYPNVLPSSSIDRFLASGTFVQSIILGGVLLKGRLLGYARVSTEDQATRAQENQLRAAGCTVVYRERCSGASKVRPELTRLLAQIQPGDARCANERERGGREKLV